jgi:hypothetical protein
MHRLVLSPEGWRCKQPNAAQFDEILGHVGTDKPLVLNEYRRADARSRSERGSGDRHVCKRFVVRNERQLV